ncbi:MAG: tyrosine-type recombinase/integrase [Candidatus Woesearchaeota archaeon]
MDILEVVKKEMLRRRLSRRTISTYLFYIRKFLLFCPKPPKEFSKKDIKDFLEQKGYLEKSGSTTNVALMSLRFMMEECLRKSMRLNIRYSKTPKSLTACLTKEEVRMLIDSFKNEKHKLLISLMYGAGLRVSEAVKLKKEDIDLCSGYGWVRRGKGNKDRPFIIPISLKQGIIKRMEIEGTYIFPGRSQHHLSVRSVQQILKRAGRKVLKKHVNPHMLRHSFATHLIEDGTDLMAIQSLLGHNEARTTIEYLHVVKPKMLNVKSPLDCLEDKNDVSKPCKNRKIYTTKIFDF